MKIAICSDENYEVQKIVIEEVKNRGHEIKLFGSLLTQTEESWALSAKQAAQAIAVGECHEGIFFCYTATGVTMAANKIPGIRAALCTDGITAKEARIWNHANVLTLSNRLLSPDVAKEILAAWFETPFSAKGEKGVQELQAIDQEFRK